MAADLTGRSNTVAEATTKAPVRLLVNGQPYELLVPVHRTLLETLREDLQLTGTKHGCEVGECGMCTVLLDGEPVLSCLTLTVEVEGRTVTTVEGLERGGELHPLQKAFAQMGATQCGYCTPAMLLTAKSLLDRSPSPSEDEIREALSGVLCRCTGYIKIIAAVEMAARQMGAPDSVA
ncbi:4-hydroxybenzoyl-CoA reductase subunit gamma [bacterium HR24]|jgi:carbon-monoxide dehydrogenase small subunit|nr:4-hydroxybenzoyl-CoA reductase subunit gamma [bacterium HR24]